MVSKDDFDSKATNLNFFNLHINFEQKYPKLAIVHREEPREFSDLVRARDEDQLMPQDHHLLTKKQLQKVVRYSVIRIRFVRQWRDPTLEQTNKQTNKQDTL